MTSPKFQCRLGLIWVGLAALVSPNLVLGSQPAGCLRINPGRATRPQHWREAQSCGVACGYLLARLVGREITYDEAVGVIPIERGGTSLLGLQKGLEVLGVSTTVLKAKPRDLDHLATPMIAHVLPRHESGNSVGHFLLVLKIDERSVRYIEPNYAASIETVPRNQFVRGWSGYVIEPQSRKTWPKRGLTFVLWSVITASASIGSFPLARWAYRHRPIAWWRGVRILTGFLVSCVTLGCAALPVNVNPSFEGQASTDELVSRPVPADVVRLVAWNTEADLGVLPQNGAAEGLFRIENQGPARVRLHLGSPTCRCSEARLERETLASGESTVVRMLMRSRPRQAGPADARVYIESEGGAWAEALSVHGIELGANFPNYTYTIGGPTNEARTASIVGNLFLRSSSSEPKVDVRLDGSGLESVSLVQNVRIGQSVEMSGCVRRECAFTLGVNPRAGVVRERREVVLPVRVTIDGEASKHSIRLTILPSGH